MSPSPPTHLIGLSIGTCGQDKENLGSDEADIIAISWICIDTRQAKVIDVQDRLVLPDDIDAINWETVAEKRIAQADLLKASKLAHVLHEFDQSIARFDNCQLVTDGNLPIRQVLHPDALRKNIQLSDAFYSYFDIRKELPHLVNNNNEDVSIPLRELLHNGGDITIDDGDSAVIVTDDDQQNVIASDCRDLGRAILHTLTGLEDVGFREPERVKIHVEHGICSKDELIDSNLVVRARGLPWQSSDRDVTNFFVGLNIAKGGVALCLSKEGRRNGEALVRFDRQEHRDMALRRHRHFMGNRYIEIYRATGDDFIQVAAGSNTEAQEFLSRGAAVIIRMRGLPYDANVQQILDFFASGENATSVMDDHGGVLFVQKSDGRATGDAFVLFRTEADAQKALNKHKEVIGTRYIELFRSTTAEVQQVLNKCMEISTRNNEAAAAAVAAATAAAAMSMQPATMLPSQMVISGCRKDCIRLRGLPYEAQVQHILEFLGEFSKHIVFQGVHMVYNAQGHPSGEAFIQMTSEQASSAAAQDRHNKYMQMAKKQRYIEVFQCSADDMNLVLTGPSSLIPAGVRMPLSPGKNSILDRSLFHLSVTPHHHPIPQNNLLNIHILQQLALQNQLAAARGPLFATPGGGAGLFPMMNHHHQGPIVYWPYPSPPVSPSNSYLAALAANQQAAAAAAAHQQQLTPIIVLVRGLPFTATVADLLALFNGFADINADCVQIQRATNGTPTGDALVIFRNRADAERAVLERNGANVGARPIELFLCSI